MSWARPGARSLALGCFVLRGARHESRARAGLPHLVEHALLFGGRPLPGGPLAEAMDRLGGWINAGTGRESLSVQAWVPLEQAEAAHALLREVLRGPRIDPETWRREIETAVAEAAQADPADALWDAGLSLALAGHPLTNPIAGEPEALRGLAPEAAQAWWEEAFTGASTVLVAVGAVEHAALVERWRWLESLPPRPPPAPPELPLPPWSGGNAPAVADVGSALAWLLPFPAPEADPGFAARMAHQIAWGGLSSRLAAALRERPGGGYPPPARFEAHRGLTVSGVVLPHPSAAVSEAAEQALAHLAGDGPVERELETARAFFLAQLDLERDDPVRALARLGEELTVLGRPRAPEHWRAGLEGVTAEAVRSLFAEAWARRLFVTGA